jgi:hypothetical protein
MRSPFSMILPLLLTTISTACHHGGTAGTEPVQQTRVRIENTTSLDMDIYVLGGDNRSSRLGFAPASRITTFSLPTVLTAGSTTFRFQARPVRGSGEAVTSEQFGVRSGDDITWTVPGQ